MDNLELLVDPAVSKQKFEFELNHFRALEVDNHKRGWWLLKAEFPEVFLVFAAPQLKPPCVVFGVVIDFINYDLWPPSVRFVDPFTKQPYKSNEIISPLLYRVKSPEGSGTPGEEQLMSLVQAHGDGNPFLCLPGVREYHQHPAHTGDSWFQHREKGEGTLYFLLNTIYEYGIKPIQSYRIDYRIGLIVNPVEKS